MTTEKKSIWQKATSGGKVGFDKLWGYADKLGAPVNKLTNKIGSEAFWPTSIDKEADKAARILRSFCKDGIYTDEVHQTDDGPKQKQRVLKKIPAEVIRNAKGLAIFTTMRSGLWFSGAGGSGLVIARLPDGTWSPPSGILLHTAGIGFLVGVDIYDCVLVLNTDEAVAAFSRWRATVGGEISAVAGPVGVGGILETELHKRQSPIFTYLRSRGFYAGVQIDGTVIIERNDENEKFYGHKYSAQEILGGKIRHPPYELRGLTETLKSAQGDKDVDESALPTEPPPADFEVVKSDHVFGVPDREDPDPYGVLALEKEGMLIKESGSQQAADHEHFEFKPALTSPVYSTYNKSSQRGSLDSSNNRNSWRSSALSINSVDKSRYVTSDITTQTDLPTPDTPTLPTTPELEGEDEPTIKMSTPESNRVLPAASQNSPSSPARKLPPPLPLRIISSGTRTVPPPPLPHRVKPSHASTPTSANTASPVALSTAAPEPVAVPESVRAVAAEPESRTSKPLEILPTSPMSELDDIDLDDDDDDVEVVEVQQVQQIRARPVEALRPQVVRAGSGARVVTVGPRVIPPVPSRNPIRAVRTSVGDVDDASASTSARTSETQSNAATSPDQERKESVTSQEYSPSIKAKTPSVRSVNSFKSTHSTAAASGMPGGFPTINDPTPPSPPAIVIPKRDEESKPFTYSPVDPRHRISMANMRLGLADYDDDDDRSPSPSPKPPPFSPIHSPNDMDSSHGLEFA